MSGDLFLWMSCACVLMAVWLCWGKDTPERLMVNSTRAIAYAVLALVFAYLRWQARA